MSMCKIGWATFALLLAATMGCGPSAKSDRQEAVSTVSDEAIGPPAVKVPLATDPAPATTDSAKPSPADPSTAVTMPAPAAKPQVAPQLAAKPPVPLEVNAVPAATNVPLIPREALFGNPDKAMARLGHDAKRLAYLAAVDGVLNVWVGPANDPAAAKPVTQDKKRGIRSYSWAYTNDHILYTQDADGDENFHVYSVNLATNETRDLTPLKNVRAQIDAISHRFPEELMIGLNDRDPRYHDVYRVNLVTGERKLVEENKQEFAGYIIDEDFRIRYASKPLESGGSEFLEPDGKGGWKEFFKVTMEDEMTTSPAGFDKSGDVLYLMDSRGRDTGALFSLNLKTGEKKLIAENPKADIGGVLSHPTENTIEAVSFTFTRREWQILDQQIKADLDFLATVADGEIEVASRSLDDKTWVVAYLLDDGPVKYYLYDRPAKKTTFLFSNRKALEGLPLVKMHPLVIKSRDGLELVSYLSLPKGSDTDGDGRPDRPLPMVLDVHGGPWARDSWGFNSDAQLWANRGYAYLNVNFRGSTGFGKNFVNAGNREWAGKMHNDLLDAVNYCIENKIAEPKKIAIVGGSYGGYATLVALTMTPDVFACGVDIVGPSNIVTLLNTIPPYWASGLQMFKDRVGDHTTEEGKKFLEERSPLSKVDNIKKPLLIAQGANDPRVKQSEADQIVKAMQEKKIPVVYVLYPDEGHGFARPANSLSFNAVQEAFLAENLGGRFEPIGDAFKGSNITVPVGASDVPGLEAALKQHEAASPK